MNRRTPLLILTVMSLLGSLLGWETAAGASVKVATFDVDATPPLGSMMAYDRVARHDELSLRCRGIVVQGAGEPIVLCAVDWLGISNDAHDVFRATLARGAGTSKDRVAVHTLHQHDAPACDFLAEQLLREAGTEDAGRYAGGFARDLLKRLEEAVRAAVAHPHPVTHVGWGEADVEGVASNRRILGPDGKVRAVRWTATKDAELRNEPVGVIDPRVAVVSFWNEERPLAVLSYYACHPQSYYRTGIPSPDFPGIARFLRGQAVPEALHVHFNGAGGNIGAGKYNDGSKENRIVLAQRLADGMRRAWEGTQKQTLSAEGITWLVAPVALPPAPTLDEGALRARLSPSGEGVDKLAWLLRCQAGQKIDVSALGLNEIRLVHMPGELFVEYQLAAQQMRPDLHVAMAAYGDYGPGYIGTTVAYDEGGYETSERASNVAPAVESVLRGALRTVLRPAESAAANSSAK